MHYMILMYLILLCLSSAGSRINRIPQISYGSTSAVLSDKTKFKYFFRTCPSDVHQASALAALFRKYSLPEVGTVATNDIYGKGLADLFEKEVTGMADVPVNVVSRQRFDVNARAATVRPKILKVIPKNSKLDVTLAKLNPYIVSAFETFPSAEFDK